MTMQLITLVGVPVSSDIALRLSMLEALSVEEADREREVLRARRYHEGKQGAKLTDRLTEFLADGTDDFRLNVCSNVVTAVSERLTVTGFDCEDLDVLQWSQDTWLSCNLDAMQVEVHEGALRDGEYFVIVDWDPDENRVRFIPYERYTSVDVGGTGQGCMMFYEEDDLNQRPQVAMKQWIERTADDTFERRNLYYPDRIEKWIRSTSGQWALSETIDWTSQTGDPLGIAVIHFRNKNLKIEAADAMPLQRAINKSLVDLLAASDLTAFRIFVALGFIPTTDGGPLKSDRSNLLPIEPGQIVGTTTPPSNASFDAIDPSEIAPQLDLTHQLILWLAATTNTPVARFISTKLIASDETLKEQEGPLLSRVAQRQVAFGNSWVQCIQTAARLENAYGETSEILNDQAVLEPIWAEAQSRSQQERMDLLKKKQSLGIPEEQLWREAGYSRRQIEDMKSMKLAAQQQEFERQVRLSQLSQENSNNETQEQGQGRDVQQQQ